MLMVAIVASEELQVTVLVTSWMVPSVNVPVAVNCSASPSGSDGMAGVTAMETSAADVTVNPVEPVMEPDAALTVVEPVALLVAWPEVLIMAMLVLAQLHATNAVRSCVLPSV
jgi:hypothetical protein